MAHRAHHAGVAECRLVARREVSLGLRLLTGCVWEGQGRHAAQPRSSSPTQVMGMDSKRELIVRDWTYAVGRPGQLIKKIIPRFLEQTFDGPTVRSGHPKGQLIWRKVGAAASGKLSSL